ncbi:tetratricopeptide repeat protein [uncultured Polaribacter sp.]|uniref:tetratricopeptide repeat protein n=1 Tax=uncultured Polaribacter sp. TaxID=174711 RepID=UPI0026022B9B|nr:tetratricopeptide repeat protein [uncultured Polaribacter sp.]
MKLKIKLLFIFSCIGFFAFSQDMQEGFTYLETGKYKQAETFFSTVLKKYPANKTARLCYGRAVGLHGNATKAVSLFTNLLQDYPKDFEVKLNYAEALLWSKQYTKAKTYYAALLQENDKSFPALLGYANTLSNLKEYQNALVFVDKALAVLPGNANALVSKKYMRLGLANLKIQTRAYESSEELLKENLQTFENDKETLQNLANLYLISEQFDKAKMVFEQLGENPVHKLLSLNGIALVYHLKGDEKTAILTSKKALNTITTNTLKSLQNQTKERYIQALIWNKKFSLAQTEIETLLKENANPESWMLSLRATLNIYKSDFKKSLEDYNLILQKDSASFDGNLGKANALKAAGFINKAYQSAGNTLKFYKNQKDATNFIKQLDLSFTPFVEVKAAYSFDNGDNVAYAYTANSELALSTKFKLLANYNYRITSNSTTDLEATANNLLFGASYQLKNNITLRGSLGVTNSNSKINNFNQFITDIALQIKPFKLQNLELGYKRDIQNFNAELLNREIIQNNLIVNYSLNTNFNLGWFTQYYYTFQSDDNARNLLFTSLYYNILPKPSLKAGINYQYISFKNQVPTIYFSPNRFNAVEVFINIIKDEAIAKPKEWFYGLTVATGYQFIEEDKRQAAYRVQGQFGYKFSNSALLNVYGTRSNIASATAAGFTFNEIGLRFKWLYLTKPIFKK